MIVVADTTPINYLILIEEIHVLPKLYGRVVIPLAVREELLRPRTPGAVRAWMESLPVWLEVQTASGASDPALARLDAGERSAITLAEELGADQLIVDDAFARRIAEARGLSVIGTIGVLREAGERGLVDLATAFQRLQLTSFHVSPALLAKLLNEAGS
jgi:predicted nucleic acid-binding protein